jgi:hypothetical protein
MIKHVASVATVATLALSLAATSIASAQPRERHPGRAAGASAQPDEVIRWNQELLTLLVAPGAQPASSHPTRTMAITEIAVYDAVNAILRADEPLLVDVRGPRAASPEAAAAAAAHTALETLLPSEQTTLDTFFQGSLARLGSGELVRQGIRVGERSAVAVLAARANDGANATPPVFTPGTAPGEYQLTPPAFAPAAFTQVAHVTPFVLENAGQFRPPPPPVLTSARYAADFNEVKTLGRRTGAVRTPDQTAIGTFWGAAPVWIVWNQVAEQAGATFGNDLERNAQMFAQLDTTLADAAIALYDAKYAYHRWRPVTAITAADQGNPTTTPDPAGCPWPTPPTTRAIRAPTPSSARRRRRRYTSSSAPTSCRSR